MQLMQNDIMNEHFLEAERLFYKIYMYMYLHEQEICIQMEKDIIHY